MKICATNRQCNAGVELYIAHIRGMVLKARNRSVYTGCINTHTFLLYILFIISPLFYYIQIQHLMRKAETTAWLRCAKKCEKTRKKEGEKIKRMPVLSERTMGCITVGAQAPTDP
eukprot:TRINITY_DN4481_c0_g2_i3.p2 TRINITY_DN4481_c0_g2~~TRINITY_DN4481_c0_g2_i3.p2  ORF type:complete len:115 (+),score=12.14 TRINITY_DN4481_c0_g2_i3:433-777(+)